MTTTQNEPLFNHIRFIMVEPSHPGNVGAAARAIKTMGFQQLCLVNPKSPTIITHENAIAMASGATDVLENTTIADSLEQALAPVSLAFALTARPRYIGPPPKTIRESACIGAEHLRMHPTGQIAIVLGTERTGLENHAINQCQYLCYIPANPEYSSLNVAQALQLAAWELRYALLEQLDFPLVVKTPGKILEADLPATQSEIQSFLTHWEQALTAVDFLDPNHPKKLMVRMQQLFTRSQLSHAEVAMLRGVCTAMMKTARKINPTTTS
ncbi:RNA methyltransferase [Paenalcaligenes hermetiae]|uniref:tRNA (cytidine/uridine-2'-O-)-methyltransferase TrmJ n=1 Tax=Paenalcaligenes hermetiae TaxID=1157987 RepID=A0ABP9LZH1_9BURK